MDLLTMRRHISGGKPIFDLPLRVVYYARVSTEKAEQLNSLDNQVYYFEDYIKKNSAWTYAGGYIDEGVSGASALKRDGFLRMIRDGKNGGFDLIVTKEISRFARDTLDSIQYTRELLGHGVGVFFQSDNINTLHPDAELRLTIMASIAQDEVRKLSERLRFGYKRSIERGRVLGQNNMLGYGKADGVLTVNEEQAKIVRRIFELYVQGRFGIRRIARELEHEGMLSPFTGKMLSPETVKSVITNPKYKGYYCSGKTVSLDYRNRKRIRMPPEEWNVYKTEAIPAIVSEDIWEEANRLYRERSAMSKKHAQACQSRYALSGKIFCGDHGTAYHRHVYKSKKNGEQEVWNCKLYRQKGKADGCDSPTLYSKELYGILGGVFQDVYGNKDNIINGLLRIYESIDAGGCGREIGALRKEIAKHLAKKDALLDLLLDGVIDKAEFVRRNGDLSRAVSKLEAEIAEQEENARLTALNKQSNERLRAFMERELADTGQLTGEMTSALLDRITVRKIGGDKRHLRLEIALTVGRDYVSEVKPGGRPSLSEIGISQAQVSRLEKNAIHQMKKYL
ncbi:MAG: recombinase family protein [Oscillospiraceae bacterium]|nr:recombinase family protein [Oscillospiraceae bacterium]